MVPSLSSSIHFFGLALLGAWLAMLVFPVLFGQTTRADSLAARTAMNSRIPLWREERGRVIWSNPAYDALARQGHPFASHDHRQRVQDRWFNVERSDGVGQATPADDLVRAETGVSQLKQTMAAAFSHLPIGLAIFDRERLLQTFNPALVDLTTLPPDFLSRRPSLLSVLDAMRNRNMVPEPENWKNWSRQIAQMETAAASGQYEDTWALPGGQTYHVTGRPHPEGGLALMVEDISAETIRSRRYRAELELCQAVIDTMEEGLAVFAVSGQLVMSNAAYESLWGHDPGQGLVSVGIRQLAAHWRAQSAPTQIWAEAEDFVSTIGLRTAWEGEARLSDGRLVTCRFAPLAEGATLAGFRAAPARAAPRAVAKG